MAPLTPISTISMSSGFTMPVLGLGVFRNDDCQPACLAALECGYRHIDSARVYYNEAQVGEAVRKSGVPRDQVFITTKIYDLERGFDGALQAVDDSLKNFGFNYIDLYLIHSPLFGKTKRLETYRALLEAKEAGKIRTVGVSNYSPDHIEEIRAAGYELPAVNQVELHPFCQQQPIVEYCKKNGIVVQAYTPLVRGKLDSPVILEIAQKYNKTLAQVAVRWSLQSGLVPLPKSSQPKRVVANADVFDFELSPEDMTKIDALDRGKDGAVTWNPVDAA
ncbi:hypothetical protein JAAARDRAFT_165426 [Jaapia argillacea MUCL 33604]|uniref:NADP-dependent oxidoreductase domain-containing protein n=1 Tax=Jaapia argillacea MUCL 33604 TaxID=933084 RepID=A0A067P486_9AGAM|nr:hypothetical protein JAAARDRAFT_165426 [Jaapia argillacea MUCL 33604]